MTYKFAFDFPEAANVSLIGDFNEWNRMSNVMELDEDGKWTTYVELPPGKHKYKFLIDNIYTLNDPLANLYMPSKKGDMHSLLIIDHKGDVLMNTEQYTMNLDRYVLWDKLEGMPEQQGKKTFLESDEQIICKLQFSQITGVHSVTAVWYAPGMRYYHMSEGLLWTPEGEENKPVELNFYINIRGSNPPVGKWKLKLYLNGGFIFDDDFIIKPITYTSNHLFSTKI